MTQLYGRTSDAISRDETEWILIWERWWTPPMISDATPPATA